MKATFPEHVFPALARAFLRSSAIRRLAVSVTGTLALALLPALPSTAQAGVHLATTPAAASAWFDRFNAWRANAGQGVLTENTTYSAGDVLHATYMVQTGQVTHSESTAYPQYTMAGDVASQNSNIFVSSSTGTSDTQAIDWWMGAPFHAMAMMDPRLATTGFGSYRQAPSPSSWQMGAAVNVNQGMTAPGRYPVYFPGNGSTEPLTAYSGNEFPDPTGPTGCPGYSGLPLFIEVGANVNTTAGPVHTLLGNGSPLTNCVIDSTNATFAGNLKWHGGVIVFPQQPLQNGVTYTVAVTVNSVPYTWSFTVGPLTVAAPPAGWLSLGGILTSDPDASSWAANRTDAFVRGLDNQLWHTWWDGTSWHAFQSLGGALASDPSAVSWGNNRIDIFTRSTDNQLWHTWWDGVAWRAWQPLGGSLSSGPDVASWAVNRLDIFARGFDNQLWHSWWDGISWNWQPLGGVLTSDPTAVSWGPNRIDTFARGLDNQIWHTWWDGVAWRTWQPLGGNASSAPDVASCASGHLDVFVRGADNGLWQLGYNGTSWTGWKSLGGYWTSSPSAVCRPGTNTIDLFARFADNALWTASVTGS